MLEDPEEKWIKFYLEKLRSFDQVGWEREADGGGH